jgi:hypothetical protein
MIAGWQSLPIAPKAPGRGILFQTPPLLSRSRIEARIAGGHGSHSILPPCLVAKMPFDLVQPTIGLVFLTVCALIGEKDFKSR